VSGWELDSAKYRKILRDSLMTHLVGVREGVPCLDVVRHSPQSPSESVSGHFHEAQNNS
jgi:hypothetical protein